MGKPKTETVGGGSATGTADAFNQFLLQGLNSGAFGGQTGPNGATTGVAQAQGQTNGFGGAINNMLSGRPGDPTQYSQYFDLMKNGGNGGFGGIGNAPGFQSTEFGVHSASPNNYNAAFGEGGFGNQRLGVGAAGSAVDFNAANFARPGDVFGANGVGGLMQPNMNDPQFAALAQMQNQRTQLDAANLRARYTAGGGSSLGTGASMAESQYLAQANPANTMGMYQIGQQMQNMDMQNRGLNAQTMLGQRGQNIDMRNQDMNSMLSAATSTAGNQTNANIASAQNMTQGNIAGMNARLQAMGMDSDSAFRAMQQNNANQFGQNQAANQFNQGNYQFGVNAGLQNQGMQNQYALGQAGIGAQMAGLSSQAQQAAMQQLFGSYNNAQQIGTPQAQTVQTPSMFGQIMSGLGQVVGMGSNIYGAMNGGGFGNNGGGQNNFNPQFRPPAIQQTPGSRPQTPFGLPGGPIYQPPRPSGMMAPQGNMGFNPQFMDLPQYRAG